ncbi:MAG: hypothetical protein EOP45_16500 [Sphingobacteriaceae bacterium]|nr:MAG: hypothetical protein EOP45_16500 [Sphingobacteriaceae bacterium]
MTPQWYGLNGLYTSKSFVKLHIEYKSSIGSYVRGIKENHETKRLMMKHPTIFVVIFIGPFLADGLLKTTVDLLHVNFVMTQLIKITQIIACAI